MGDKICFGQQQQIVEILQLSALYLCGYSDNSVNYAPVNMPDDFSLKYDGVRSGF